MEAEVRYGDEQLRVRIRDDGKGMDPEVLKKEGAQDIGDSSVQRNEHSESGHSWIFGAKAEAGTEVQLSIPATIAYRNSTDRPRFGFLRRVQIDEQRF